MRLEIVVLSLVVGCARTGFVEPLREREPASCMEDVDVTELSWSTVDDFQQTPGQDIMANAVAADEGGRVLVAGGGHLFESGGPPWTIRESTNGGSGWVTNNVYTYGGATAIQASGLCIDRSMAAYAVAGANAGGSIRWLVLQSADGGSWQLIDDDAGIARGCSMNPGDEQLISGDAGGRWIVRRRAAGVWSTSDDFLYDQKARSWAISSAAGASYAVGNGDDSNGRHWLVRRSSDGGATWSTVDVYQLVAGEIAEARAVFAAAGGVYVSGMASDGVALHWIVRGSRDGMTWSTLDNYQLDPAGAAIADAVIADGDGRLYAAGGVFEGPSTYWIIRTSADGGLTWNTSDTYRLVPDHNAGVSGLAVDAWGQVFAVGTARDAADSGHWIVRRLGCL